MSTEIDGTVYSGDYEELHGRKPGEPAPEPVLAPQPEPVTVYSSDYAAIKSDTIGGQRPPAAAPAAQRQPQDDGVRAKVITTESAPAPLKSAPASTE